MKPVKRKHEIMTCTCSPWRNALRGTLSICEDARRRGEPSRFFCRGCRRFVPVCRGASDAFSDYCDGCYAVLTALGHVKPTQQVTT